MADVERFEIGSIVTWSDKVSDPGALVAMVYAQNLKLYGPGPFRVSRIEESEQTRPFGHPQVVVVERNGVELRSVEGGVQIWSGGWFKHVRQ